MKNQISMFDTVHGEMRRDAGKAKVEANSREWIAWMRRVAAMEYVRTGMPVSTDSLRAAADEAGRQPHHPNAWGSVFKGRDWKPVGFIQSAYKSNNARVIRLWVPGE